MFQLCQVLPVESHSSEFLDCSERTARQNYSGSLKRYVSHSTVDQLVHLYRTGDVKSLQDKHGPERK